MKLFNTFSKRLTWVLAPVLSVSLAGTVLEMNRWDWALIANIIIWTSIVLLAVKWVITGKWSWNPLTPPWD